MLFSPDIMIDMFTKYGGMFMKGAGMALLLSLITIVMSMIFGTLVALARMSKVAPLRWLVSIYIEIFRLFRMLKIQADHLKLRNHIHDYCTIFLIQFFYHQTTE